MLQLHDLTTSIPMPQFEHFFTMHRIPEFEVVDNAISEQDLIDVHTILSHHAAWTLPLYRQRHWKDTQMIANIGGISHPGFPYEVKPEGWYNFYEFETPADRIHFFPEDWTGHLEMVRELFAPSQV